MSIEGNIRTLELPELLQWLAQGRKTGILTFTNGEVTKRLLFDNGRVTGSASSDPREYLGQWLLQRGTVDAETERRARQLHESSHVPYGKVLVSTGAVSESELNEAIRVKTAESIYELFSWPEAEFRFLQGEPKSPDGVLVSLDVTHLVIEGLQRLDEQRAAAAAKVAVATSAAAPPEPLATSVVETSELDAPATLPETASPVEVEEEKPSIAPPATLPELPVVPPSVEAPVPAPIAEPVERRQPVEPSEPARFATQRIEALPADALLAASPDDSEPEVDAGADEGETPVVLDNAYENLLLGRAQRSGRDGRRSALVLGAVAAAVAIAVTGWVFAGWRSSGGTASVAVATPAKADAGPGEMALDPLAAPPLAGDALEAEFVEGLLVDTADTEAAEALEPVAATEDMQARYEAQLEDLRRQLAASKRLATERERLLETRPVAPPVVSAAANASRALPPDARRVSQRPPVVPDAGAGSAPATQSPGTLADTPTTEVTAAPTVVAQPPPASALRTPARPAPETKSAAATAKVGTEERVQRGGGLVPPSLVTRPRPSYPAAARRLGRRASVKVQVLVDENGLPAEVRQVGPPVGMGFDREALRAARLTRWKPATKGDVPVSAWVDLSIDFQL